MAKYDVLKIILMKNQELDQKTKQYVFKLIDENIEASEDDIIELISEAIITFVHGNQK